MITARNAFASGLAAAVLLLGFGAAAPVSAQVSMTDPDGPVACSAFERVPGGAWTATASTMLNFDNGTSVAVRPGQSFVPTAPSAASKSPPSSTAIAGICRPQCAGSRTCPLRRSALPVGYSLGAASSGELLRKRLQMLPQQLRQTDSNVVNHRGMMEIKADVGVTSAAC